WPVSNAHFPEMVAGFERLRAASKIRSWGVSNFSVRQMEDLFRIPQGDRCATNQVPYSIGDRAIERDLLPWCEQHGMPVEGCCVIPRLHKLAQRAVARQQPSRWLGPSAAVTSLRFPNPVPQHT